MAFLKYSVSKYYKSDYIKPTIEKIINLYDQKMNEVVEFLKNNYGDENYWDTNYAISSKDDVFSQIYYELKKYDDLRCISKLDDYFNIIIDKYKESFSIIDDEADDILEKYEQYFDNLCDMPLNIHSYICKCLKEIECTETFDYNIGKVINEKINSKSLDVYKEVIVQGYSLLDEDDNFALVA